MMRAVTARTRDGGTLVVDVSLPAAFAEVLPRHRTVMAVESAAYHEPRLRRHPEDYDPWIRTLLEEGLACSAPEYARCKKHQKLLRSEMDRCFQGVDALLTPATTCPAPDAGSTGDPAFNSPWSYTGLPTISVSRLPGSRWAALGHSASRAGVERERAVPRRPLVRRNAWRHAR